MSAMETARNYRELPHRFVNHREPAPITTMGDAGCQRGWGHDTQIRIQHLTGATSPRKGPKIVLKKKSPLSQSKQAPEDTVADTALLHTE